MLRIDYIWSHSRIITAYTDAEKKELASLQELYKIYFQNTDPTKHEKQTDIADDCLKGTLFETKENGLPLHDARMSITSMVPEKLVYDTPLAMYINSIIGDITEYLVGRSRNIGSYTNDPVNLFCVQIMRWLKGTLLRANTKVEELLKDIIKWKKFILAVRNQKVFSKGETSNPLKSLDALLLNLNENAFSQIEKAVRFEISKTTLRDKLDTLVNNGLNAFCLTFEYMSLILSDRQIPLNFSLVSLHNPLINKFFTEILYTVMGKYLLRIANSDSLAELFFTDTCVTKLVEDSVCETTNLLITSAEQYQENLFITNKGAAKQEVLTTLTTIPKEKINQSGISRLFINYKEGEEYYDFKNQLFSELIKLFGLMEIFPKIILCCRQARDISGPAGTIFMCTVTRPQLEFLLESYKQTRLEISKTIEKLQTLLKKIYFETYKKKDTHISIWLDNFTNAENLYEIIKNLWNDLENYIRAAFDELNKIEKTIKDTKKQLRIFTQQVTELLDIPWLVPNCEMRHMSLIPQLYNNTGSQHVSLIGSTNNVQPLIQHTNIAQMDAISQATAEAKSSSASIVPNYTANFPVLRVSADNIENNKHMPIGDFVLLKIDNNTFDNIGISKESALHQIKRRLLNSGQRPVTSQIIDEIMVIIDNRTVSLIPDGLTKNPQFNALSEEYFNIKLQFIKIFINCFKDLSLPDKITFRQLKTVYSDKTANIKVFDPNSSIDICIKQFNCLENSYIQINDFISTNNIKFTQKILNQYLDQYLNLSQKELLVIVTEHGCLTGILAAIANVIDRDIHVWQLLKNNVLKLYGQSFKSNSVRIHLLLEVSSKPLQRLVFENDPILEAKNETELKKLMSRDNMFLDSEEEYKIKNLFDEQSSAHLPLTNFKWTIDKCLARSAAPGYKGSDQIQAITKNILEFLIQNKIEKIISLNSCDISEESKKLLADNKIIHEWCPLQDYGIPTSDQLNDIILSINTSTTHTRPTLIHCGAGQGRTGTIITLWQISNGKVKLKNELTSLMSNNHVETKGHKEFIENYFDNCNNKARFINIKWVEYKKILRSSRPYYKSGDAIQTIDENVIQFLKQNGIDAILSLNTCKIDDEHNLLFKHGISYKQVAIQNQSICTQKEALSIIEYLSTHYSNNKCTLIYCNAGVGRTGLAVTLWLIVNNIKYRNFANESQLKTLIDKQGVESKEQKLFLLEFGKKYIPSTNMASPKETHKLMLFGSDKSKQETADNIIHLILRSLTIIPQMTSGVNRVSLIFIDHNLVQQFIDKSKQIGITHPRVIHEQIDSSKVNNNQNKTNRYTISLTAEEYNILLRDHNAYEKLIRSYSSNYIPTLP